MKRKNRKNLFVAGTTAAILIALAVVTGIIYVAAVTVQTILAD